VALLVIDRSLQIHCLSAVHCRVVVVLWCSDALDTCIIKCLPTQQQPAHLWSVVQGLLVQCR
jgi:hypothetical protein